MNETGPRQKLQRFFNPTQSTLAKARLKSRHNSDLLFVPATQSNAMTQRRLSQILEVYAVNTSQHPRRGSRIKPGSKQSRPKLQVTGVSSAAFINVLSSRRPSFLDPTQECHRRVSRQMRRSTGPKRVLQRSALSCQEEALSGWT